MAARLLNTMPVALSARAGTVASLALWFLCQVGNQSFGLFLRQPQLVSRVAQAGLELMVVLLPQSQDGFWVLDG